PELERKPHLLELLRKGNDVARRSFAVRRRTLDADVDDRHRRRRLALPGERTSADVAPAPADDPLRGAVDDDQRRLEPPRAGGPVALVVDHAGMPVEDELVLRADRVAERDEARVVARTRDEHLLTLAFLADVVRRGRDVGEQLRAGESELRRGRPRLPHVLADGRAHGPP